MPDYMIIINHTVLFCTCLFVGKEYSVSGYADFFRTKFLSLNKTKRNMAVHSTCCTDTKAMQVIISSML